MLFPSHDSSVLNSSVKMMQDLPLCDHCLGRQFAWVGTNMTNQERGQSIKHVLCMESDQLLKIEKSEDAKNAIALLAGNGMHEPAREIASENEIDFERDVACGLCTNKGQSLFEQIPSIASTILSDAAGIEFNSFLIGSVPVPALVEKQDELSAKHSLLHTETLKSHFNRELGRYLQPLLVKEVDFAHPDVVFVYDMMKNKVKTQVNPIFIGGRYRKLKRGIPQSKWDCSACNGRGCQECKETGRRYPDSISEYVGVPSQAMFGGSRFKFHAAGREDVDVLMLGSGRPFVVEVSRPLIRTLDLHELAKKINKEARKKVEVLQLEFANRERLQKFKSEAGSNIKEYRAIIRVDREVDSNDIQLIERSFEDVEIEQRTPHRVSHRRADLVRIKRVYHVHVKKKKKNQLEAVLKVQGGTYVKELISGDEGRTVPSIAEILGVPCVCEELNVIAIYSEDS